MSNDEKLKQQCTNCKEIKLLNCFSKSGKPNGRLRVICKQCEQVRQNEWRKKFPEKPQAVFQKWRDKNYHKYKAQVKLRNAVVAGNIIRQPCQLCGKSKVHAHHSDYTKPLEVMWLCPKHHTAWHRVFKAEEGIDG